MRSAASARVGVISDTHGLLRPEALRALRGVDLIVHAGDIGTQDVLDGLGAIARVTAVRGNNDRGAWARAIPLRVTLCVAGVRIHLIHDVKDLGGDLDDVDVVICGHSHKPGIADRDGRLFLNPGSAGPRRFTLPVTLARLAIRAGTPRARIIPLLTR